MEVILLILLMVGLPTSVYCTNLLCDNKYRRNMLYNASVLSLYTNISLFVIYAFTFSWKSVLLILIFASLFSLMLYGRKLTRAKNTIVVVAMYMSWLFSVSLSVIML